METRIYEAAVQGSVISLLNLLREDALALDRFMVGCYVETPLHIASMLGHAEFVHEILSRKPELAGELDYRKSSPLHLATAKGYLEIVKELVSGNPEMCFARDQDGNNPLHIAAMKGHATVLKELVQARPLAARISTHRGETILHTCVRYCQLDSMKLLVETIGDSEFVDAKDDDENTILHLAVIYKQREAINFLITNTTVEVNALNANGFTAFDISTQNRRDVSDWEIWECLRSIGAVRAKEILRHEIGSTETKTSISHGSNQSTLLQSKGKGSETSLQTQADWLEKMRNSLMVVASLIATMSFQAAVSPPGGAWQETSPQGTSNPHTAGFPIMADHDLKSYNLFMVFNTTGFVTSLGVILLLISGLPLRRKLFTWILILAMWGAITAMTVTYLFATTTITSSMTLYSTATIVIWLWIGFMVILLLGHTIRFVKRYRQASKRMREISVSIIVGRV